MLASLIFAIGASSSTDADSPATLPATAPASGDWFGSLATTTPVAITAGFGKSVDDPAVFARLYPELARMDKAVRAVTPRIVFDALDSTNKPQMRLTQMYVEGLLFTDASTRAYAASRRKEPFLQVFDERRIRIAAIEARRISASLCLDIESIPMDARVATREEVDRSVRMVAQAVGYARSQDPNLRLFMYATFPLGEYYVGQQVASAATTRPDGDRFEWYKASLPAFLENYKKWSDANALLRHDDGASNAGGSLSSLFDGTCPQMYLFDDLKERGTTDFIPPLVRSNVDEARRYGKPVYPFVCFYLIDTTDFVPLNQWTLLMREVMTYADGAILWDSARPWDDHKTLRTRIATLMAEHKGAISDAELYATLRKELPGDAELKAMFATTQQSR